MSREAAQVTLPIIGFLKNNGVSIVISMDKMSGQKNIKLILSSDDADRQKLAIMITRR